MFIHRNIFSSGVYFFKISMFPDSNHRSKDGVMPGWTFLKAIP